MNKSLMIRLSISILIVGFGLYSYVDKQNDLTQLHIKLPQIAKEIKAIDQENVRLEFEINKFESPQNLLQIARSEQYSHLKHPFENDVLTFNEPIPLELDLPSKEMFAEPESKVAIALGAK